MSSLRVPVLLLLLALLAACSVAAETSSTTTSAKTSSTTTTALTPDAPSNATEEVEVGERRRRPAHQGHHHGSGASSSAGSFASSSDSGKLYGGGGGFNGHHSSEGGGGGSYNGHHGGGGGGAGSYNGHHGGGGGGGGSYNHGGHQKASPLRMEYAWKKMDFVFPSDHARNDAYRSGNYNYTKIIALDVDVWEKAGRKKVFVTMPIDKGVPASLATVSAEGDPHAPLLAPYPDWSWHRKGDCRSISSVYRVAIDDYDRLWVMDRGDDQQCPPKLMTFDLNNDRLLSKYEFSSNLLVNKSNLITPVVDVRDNGRNTFVYIADVIGGIIVYDHQSKSAWRVNHPLTLPDPAYSTHTIAGTTFYLADGVFGMALSPLRCEDGHTSGGHQQQGSYHGGHGRGGRCEEDRTLVFHALASVRENHVKTSVLRNRDNFPRGQNRAAAQFKSYDQKRRSQSAAQAMSPQGILFSGLLPDLAITCWNSEQPFAGWNIEVVARDPETLQFTSGVKVRYGQLWVMSCRYQRFATGTMNWNEVNYRVQSARVEDLIRGTKCDPKTNNIGSG